AFSSWIRSSLRPCGKKCKAGAATRCTWWTWPVCISRGKAGSMKRYLWRRAGGFLLTALLVNFATFFILQVLPGDPALLMLGTEGSPEAYAALRRELSLDKPVLPRYGQWLLRFIGGQWGNSWRYSLPVRELVSQAFPLSLGLALLAVGAAAGAALPVGLYMAL